MKEEHCLVTRTEAKNEFLLTDYDLDKREPPLKYLAKKNPHRFAKGDMRLYLRYQVEERALEVWKSEETLKEEHLKRRIKRKERNEKQFNKKITALRKSVRSSLFKKETKVHEHEYGVEHYDEENDHYFKICVSCSYKISYEKM